MDNKITVLIIGKTRDEIGIWSSYLKSSGVHVTLRTGDPEKLKAAINSEFADIVLADGDSFNLVAFYYNAIREHIKMPPLIAAITPGGPLTDTQARLFGNCIILPKPFSCDDLLSYTEKVYEQYCKPETEPEHIEYVRRDQVSQAEMGKKAAMISNIKYGYILRGSDIEIDVTEIIHQIGVPAHIKGYLYLRTAIIACAKDPDLINHVTKQLYPLLAEKFETTTSRVERAIRHAIEIAWDRGDADVLNGVFGYTVRSTRGKPTNSEFIALLADNIRLKYKDTLAVS
jgi:two-component system response regulator (stage 0 sporulation protein A)